MAHRIQYNSPKHSDRLFGLPSNHTSFTFDQNSLLLKRPMRSPDQAKPFQRKQTVKPIDRKRGLKNYEKQEGPVSEREGNWGKGSEYFPNKHSENEVFNQMKIIKPGTGRDNRSGTEVFRSLELLPPSCIGDHLKTGAPAIKNQLKNYESEINLIKQVNESLMKKNKLLAEENLSLKDQQEQLESRVEVLSQKCQLLEEALGNKNSQYQKNSEQILEQKSINRCLEDIILQLNARIESLMNEPSTTTQDTCDEAHLGQIQKVNRLLEDSLASLNKKLSTYEVEIAMLKRERYQAEKERGLREKLQIQNKALVRKLQDFQKARSIARVKSMTKISKAVDLDYSVSFDFDR